MTDRGEGGILFYEKFGENGCVKVYCVLLFLFFRISIIINTAAVIIMASVIHSQSRFLGLDVSLGSPQFSIMLR